MKISKTKRSEINKIKRNIEKQGGAFSKNYKHLEFAKLVSEGRYSIYPPISSAEFAKKIFVTPAYFSAIESGKCIPSRFIINNIAKEIKCDVNTLLCAAGKIPPDILHIITSKPARVSRLLHATHLLLESDFNKLLAFIDKLNNKKEDDDERK